MEGDYARGIELSDKAIEGLRGESQRWLRSILLHNLGESYERIGDIDASMRSFLEATAACTASGGEAVDSFSTYEIGWLYFVRGQLHLAAQTWERAIDLCERGLAPAFWPGGMPDIGLARINVMWNEFEKADRRVIQGMKLLEGSDNALDLVLESQVALAYLYEARGDLIAATEVIAQASQLAQSAVIPRGIGWKTLVCQAHVALAARDFVTARRAVDILARDVPTDDAYYTLRRELVEASISRAEGRASAALLVLGRVLPEAEEAGYLGIAIEAGVVLAGCLQDMGETERAVDQLLRAVDAAYSEGYVMPFVREGSAIGILLHKILYDPKSNLAASQSQREKAAFCKSLLQALETRLSRPDAVSVSPEAHLSEREKQILELLKQGMSKREIADHLWISVNTVKKHIQNIYDKTGVHDRAAASQVHVIVGRSTQERDSSLRA